MTTQHLAASPQDYPTNCKVATCTEQTIVCGVQCAVFNVHVVVCSLECTVYICLSAMCSVHSAVYLVQCTFVVCAVVSVVQCSAVHRDIQA